MFDIIGEILATMKRNKMRTFLTGFAVAWGIFMLVVLLGAGQGLENGLEGNFANQRVNTISLWPGWTSMPYKGYRADRRIRFDERTIDFVKKTFPEVGYISGNINRSTQSVAYGKEYGTWQISACAPDLFHIDNMEMVEGRFINEADIKMHRKVVIIHKQVVETLFKNGEEPLGQYIVADGIAFQVVGLYDIPQSQSFSSPIYIPFSTGQKLFDRGWGISQISFTVNGITTEALADELGQRIRDLMGPYLGFDPTDNSAMYVWNAAKGVVIYQMFALINLFLWVIGLACSMAGIVGVGNIMLVTVKERTREIGIRKALGASPWSIIRMVIIEAIFITTAAGYVGVIFGLGFTEIVGSLLATAAEAGGTGGGMFQNPTVGLGIVFAVLGLLVACGVVAGLIPSLRATRIRPIEAMRAD